MKEAKLRQIEMKNGPMIDSSFNLLLWMCTYCMKDVFCCCFSSKIKHKIVDRLLLAVKLLMLLMLVPAKQIITLESVWISNGMLSMNGNIESEQMLLEISNHSLYTYIYRRTVHLHPKTTLSLTWILVCYMILVCAGLRALLHTINNNNKANKVTHFSRIRMRMVQRCERTRSPIKIVYHMHMCVDPLYWPTTHQRFGDQDFCVVSPSTSVHLFTALDVRMIFICLICICLPLYVCQLKYFNELVERAQHTLLLFMLLLLLLFQLLLLQKHQSTHWMSQANERNGVLLCTHCIASFEFILNACPVRAAICAYHTKPTTTTTTPLQKQESTKEGKHWMTKKERRSIP